MREWTHAQCERCWCEHQAEWDGDRLVSVRRPHRVVNDDFEVAPCCWCASPTFVGIYVRHDPATVPACQGHSDG